MDSSDFGAATNKIRLSCVSTIFSAGTIELFGSDCFDELVLVGVASAPTPVRVEFRSL